MRESSDTLTDSNAFVSAVCVYVKERGREGVRERVEETVYTERKEEDIIISQGKRNLGIQIRCSLDCKTTYTPNGGR